VSGSVPSVTRYAHVAREAARILGHSGDDIMPAGDGSWEVATTSTRARIILCRKDRAGIVFHLAGALRLGEFCFASGAGNWPRRHGS
jgi:hypothetical protein